MKGEKRCSKCKETKRLSAFSRCAGNPDGKQYYCQACIAAGRRRNDRKRRKANISANGRMDSDGQIKCRKCRTYKSSDAFPVNTRMLLGVDSWCKECHLRANRVSHRRLRQIPVNAPLYYRGERSPEPKDANVRLEWFWNSWRRAKNLGVCLTPEGCRMAFLEILAKTALCGVPEHFGVRVGDSA